MKQIDVTYSVMIAKPAYEVFKYIADYSKDPFWRAEINETQMDTTEIKEGTIITEESRLSRKVSRYSAILKCIEFQKDKLIVCETTDKSKFWSKSTRTAETISEGITKLTYRLQFDAAITKHGLGFSLPMFFLRFYTKMMMKKYLAVLKQLLGK